MNSPQTDVTVDASVIAALILDDGAAGRWAGEVLTGKRLHAPALLPFEVSSVFRKRSLNGLLSDAAARSARSLLVELPCDLYPHALAARRSWALRQHLNAYDASYVGLAELLGTPFITLDRRLAAAPGIKCPIIQFS